MVGVDEDSALPHAFCIDCEFMEKYRSYECEEGSFLIHCCTHTKVAPISLHPIEREVQAEVLCTDANPMCDCKYFQHVERRFFVRWW
jgi:hypothetical protein